MFNNSKQERKYLIIVKKYHKADFNMILCKGKKIIKETSREGQRGWWDHILEEQTHSRPSFLFFFYNTLVLPPHGRLNLFG